MKRHLTGICLLFPALACLAADTVRTEFLALALHDPVAELYYLHEGTPRPFSASPAGLGRAHPYRGPAKLVLHRHPETFFEDPPLTPPVATVRLPENADRVLLLFSAKETQTLRVAAVSADSKGMGPGDYRIMNFASVPVLFGLDNRSVRLPPGGQRTLSNKSWNRAVTDLPVQVGLEEDTQSRLVYSSIWGHYPNRQSFVLLFDGARRSNPIQFRRLHSWPLPPPDPKEDTL